MLWFLLLLDLVAIVLLAIALFGTDWDKVKVSAKSLSWLLADAIQTLWLAVLSSLIVSVVVLCMLILILAGVARP
jgi:hypothetical protein